MRPPACFQKARRSVDFLPATVYSWYTILIDRMKTERQYLKRFRHRVGGWGILLLMLPILILVWSVAREPVISVFSGALPCYMLSGKLASEPFDRIHAGFVLDKPTIGKWLFWFTILTVVSLPYTATKRWFCNRTSPRANLAYAVCSAILGVLLLCILSWPLFWLIQYVLSMGFTPRRIQGLVYTIAGGLLVIGFVRWTFRRPEQSKAFNSGHT